jgi:hypothetical protein
VRFGDFIGLDLLRLSHSKQEGSHLVVHRHFVFVVRDYVRLGVYDVSCTSSSKQKGHDLPAHEFSKSHSAMGFDVAFF